MNNQSTSRTFQIRESYSHFHCRASPAGGSNSLLRLIRRCPWRVMGNASFPEVNDLVLYGCVKYLLALTTRLCRSLLSHTPESNHVEYGRYFSPGKCAIQSLRWYELILDVQRERCNRLVCQGNAPLSQGSALPSHFREHVPYPEQGVGQQETKSLRS